MEISRIPCIRFANYYNNPRLDDSENQNIRTIHKKSDNIMHRERQWGGNDDNNSMRAAPPPGFDTFGNSRTDSGHQNNPSAPQVGIC